MPESPFRNEEQALCVSVAEKLAAARTASGLSQKELAAQSGVSANTIMKVECASGNPSLKTIAQLAASMGMVVKIDFVKPE